MYFLHMSPKLQGKPCSVVERCLSCGNLSRGGDFLIERDFAPKTYNYIIFSISFASLENLFGEF